MWTDVVERTWTEQGWKNTLRETSVYSNIFAHNIYEYHVWNKQGRKYIYNIWNKQVWNEQGPKSTMRHVCTYKMTQIEQMYKENEPDVVKKNELGRDGRIHCARSDQRVGAGSNFIYTCIYAYTYIYIYMRRVGVGRKRTNYFFICPYKCSDPK